MATKNRTSSKRPMTHKAGSATKAALVVTPFEELCSTIRSRLCEFELHTIREMFAIADLFAQAKEAYEAETHTGHGKRNPERVPPFVDVVAKAVEKSPSYVGKYIKLTSIDSRARERLLELADGSLRMLLAVAREPDPDKRVAAIAAYEAGGAPALGAALNEQNEESPIAKRTRSDPAFANLIAQFGDPKQVLGGIAKVKPETPLPANMTAKYEELKGKTYGDVVCAITPVRATSSGKPAKPPKTNAPRTPVDVAIKGVEEKECKVGRVTLRWATTGVRVSGKPVSIATVEIDVKILDYTL